MTGVLFFFFSLFLLRKNLGAEEPVHSYLVKIQKERASFGSFSDSELGFEVC